MKITIKFSGEMDMEVDIDLLMEGRDLKDMVEQYIKENMYELMECNVTVEE
tara:strand:+ start:598 stop:750 length:153 start_codon:yes stop_codon:yes gene_type:complete